MQNEIFEKMTEVSKSSYSALQELGEINSKVLKELTELQMSLATYSIESSVELGKTLSTTRNYKDFMSAEAEYANEYGNKVMEVSRKTADILNESRDEVAGWFEKTIDAAAVVEKKKAAPKRASAKKAA